MDAVKTAKAKTLKSADKESTKKKKATKFPKIFHWRDAGDVARIDLLDDVDDWGSVSTTGLNVQQPKRVHFSVRGNPLPLRRHRTSRGFIYNPSAPSQASLRNMTLQILNAIVPPTFCNQNDTATNGTSLPLPLFPNGQAVKMSILFRMKRPNTHFTSSQRGLHRLKETAPPEISTTRTDVDNLAKFVLDSMNGILFEDDHQVCSLHVTKLLDTQGLCDGSTEICCTPLHPMDAPLLVNALFGTPHQENPS